MAAPTYGTGLSTPIIGGTSGLSNKHQPMCIQKFEYDTSTFTGTTGQSIALITIPANTMVAFLQVLIGPVALTLAGTPAVSVGDNGNSTKFVNGASTFTASLALTQAITTMPLATYTVADKLVLTLTGSSTFPGTGIIRFVIGLVDLTRDQPMTVQA